MAFGQQSGPPAGQRQIDQLSDLLAERGFDSFREARHRLGLTQRQANGRFTVAEASELIERLESGVGSETGDTLADGDLPAGVAVTKAFTDRAAQRRRQLAASTLVDIEDDALADELTRRGWCCIPPG